MFDARYFTCILQKIDNKYNIELIFNYYSYENMLRQKYEKYNLFELIILLDNSYLKTELNKKAIIDTFVNNKYDIKYYDYIFKVHAPSETVLPAFTRLAVENHNINWKQLLYNKQLYSIIILDDTGKDIMQIFNDDIIKIDDKEYKIYMYSHGCIDDINKYHNVSYVKLENLETNIETKFTKQEFIDIFKNDNVTYKNSRLINWLNGNKLKTIENK
jgi:hypothetical protein